MIDFTSIDTEAEEQAAAQVLAYRARSALRGAPDLVAHIRSIAISGQSERGETLTEWSAPMRITAADDADEVYGQLVNWVVFWASTLDVMPTATGALAYGRDKDVQGFTAATTVEGAQALTQLQVTWFLIRLPRITEHPSAGAFHADILEILGRASARYPMKMRASRAVSPRACPVCEQFTVSASWPDPDEPMNAVVQCEHCEHTIEPKTYRGILEWIVG